MEATPQQQQPPQAQPQAASQPKPAGDPASDAQRRVILAAMKIIYSSSEMVQDLVGAVRDSGDPVEGVKNATGMVLDELRRNVKGADPSIVDSAARQVAVMIAELAVKAGVIPDDMKIVQATVQAVAQGGARPTAEGPAPQQSAPAGGLLASQVGG